jgi:hypothetical protein
VRRGWEPFTQPRTGRFRRLIRIAHGLCAVEGRKKFARLIAFSHS